MKTKIYLLLISIFGVYNGFTQNKPYRDASNSHYWKNRKPFEGYWQQDVAYTIKASINDQTDIVDGEEVLVYDNNSPDTLAFLYFHLYQNAFIKGGYLEQLNLANNFKQRFGKYENAGQGTEIEKVEITSVKTPPPYTDEDGKRAVIDPVVNKYDVKPMIDFSIMRVDLQQPLLPNQRITIRIKFKTYFDAGGEQRRRMKTFADAWGNKQYDGVHWYPRICVYDRKFGWETDQHLGKEFYGDFGSYDVELTFPNHYIVDATGELQNREEVLPADLRAKLDVQNFKDKPLDSEPSKIIIPNGTTKTWKFKSINTHDFAWVADPTFRIGEELITLDNGDKVSCISLSQEPHSARWQDAASFTAKVIKVYSKDIGNYAYPKMIVADARDGMEYPMLTLDGGLSPGYYGLFAHEVGHNWFFGMVGNNETYRASLDEGFTQFLTNWCMTKIFGEIKPSKKNPNPMSRIDQGVYYGYLRDAINQNDATLNTHSDDFGGALNHGGGYGHVYYKTATMLYNLQYVLGDSLFEKAMQHYFNQWKMAHPYYEDFRNSIIQFTHADLNWFFDQWIETTKNIDYSIEEVERGKLNPGNDSIEYEIEFKRKGAMQMPLDFTIYTKDSQQFKYLIPNTYFVKPYDAQTKVLPIWRGWGILNEEYEAKVFLPKGLKIKNVQIDPTYRLADINQLNNSTKCPIYFSLDDLKRDAFDRKHYLMKWRPDVWYNQYDGVKVGLHLDGNYLNQKHVFNLTTWYNTAAGTNYIDSIYKKNSERYPVHYNFSYQTRIAKFTDLSIQSRVLDGLVMNKMGVEKTHGSMVFRVFAKSMRRVQSYYLPAYYPITIQSVSFYPVISSQNQWNNTLNLEIEDRYTAGVGSGKILLGMRTSALYSDFDYASAYINIVNQKDIGSMELRTRVFAQYMTGSNAAPESQLYLAGANPEEMADNIYTRSAGIIPQELFTYGANVNNFQYGGGLNIRGYAGYLTPVTANNNQYFMYKGNSGAALNVELDYDKFITIPAKGILKYFHLDSYLFGDAGVLQSNNPLITETVTPTSFANVTTPLMVSAGSGFALTVKRWGKHDDIKPLTVRFDMPLFLNNTPFVDNEYTKFRWVLGINRAF
ncbi:MAG: M1 family metallopeptidase [Bacteroidota bacterium]